MGLRLYRYSNRGPITIEDNRVHNCQKVHGWKTCTKPMEVVPKKFKYKQKKDNRGSTIKGVYTLVWACLRGRCVYMYMFVVCVCFCPFVFGNCNKNTFLVHI